MMRLCPLLLLLVLAGPATAGEPTSSLLVNGSFELLEKGRPVGWEILEGARNKAGTSVSDWFFGTPAHSGQRSLRFSGNEGTASWTMLQSDAVAVEPDQLLRLSAWIKTAKVRRETNQWTNCNVGLAFKTAEGEVASVDGYPVVGTPPLLGTRDWTRVERVVRVPANAATVHATCFLSLSGDAWFDDVAIERIEEPDWTVVETERFVFHSAPGVELGPADIERNERELAELEGVLGLKLPQKVLFHRYANEEQKKRVTGRGGIGHAEFPSRIHTLRASHPHEIVHLLTATVGPPESILFGEGLAVHLAGDWQGRPLDVVVRELHEAGKLPALGELVDHASFSRFPETVTYPVSGSFVRYLCETGGMGAFKQVYPRHGRTSSFQTLDRRLHERYGAGLHELESRWRAAVLGE